MKTLIRFFCLFFLMLAVAYSQKSSIAGDILVSLKGGFEVQYPKGFKYPQKETSTQGKESTSTLVMFTTENERGACLVSYNEYESSLFENKSEKVMLEGAVNGYLSGSSKMTSQKDVELNGHKGKSVVFESKSETGIYYNRFDCYIVKPKLLQIGFVGYTKTELNKKDIQDYFKSFKIFPATSEMEGVVFKSEDGAFELALPKGFENPQRSVNPVKTDAGDVDMVIYMKETEKGLVMVSYNDYPNEVFEAKDLDKMYDDAMNGFLNSQKATLISRNNIFLEDIRGISFISSAKIQNTNVFTRSDVYIKKPRLYQVVFMGFNKADLVKQNILNYFRSFNLLNR